MRFFKKNTRLFFVIALLLALVPAFAQAPQGETRKHKWMWFKFRFKKHPDAFNPNVRHDKATHEQSRKQKREEARMLKKAKREYQKGIRKSARMRKRKK